MFEYDVVRYFNNKYVGTTNCGKKEMMAGKLADRWNNKGDNYKAEVEIIETGDYCLSF